MIVLACPAADFHEALLKNWQGNTPVLPLIAAAQQSDVLSKRLTRHRNRLFEKASSCSQAAIKYNRYTRHTSTNIIFSVRYL